MDVLTTEQRHRNMKRIKSSDTRPELILRKILWQNGYRYRKNYNGLPGRPDIVLTKHSICIFVDSEFFHGKDFESGYKSKKYSSLKEKLEHSTNSEFWLKKIQRNMIRDLEVETELRGLGWTVLRFWSEEVIKNPEQCLLTVQETIFNQSME